MNRSESLSNLATVVACAAASFDAANASRAPRAASVRDLVDRFQRRGTTSRSL